MLALLYISPVPLDKFSGPASSPIKWSYLSKCSKNFLGFQAWRYKVENNKQTFCGWSFNNSKAKTRVTSFCSTSSINAPEDHERERSHRCWLSAMNQPSLGDAGFYIDPCYFYSCCHCSNCHYNCCFCPYSLSSF